MSLTVEEIAKWQEALSRVQSDGSVVLPPGSNVLCHMALASLTEREKGYKAGLEAAAKIAIKHPSSAGFDIAKDIVGAAGVLAVDQPMSGHPTEIALAEQLAEAKRENERILDLHKALMKDMSDRYDASEERCRALERDAWRYRWERENPAWETEAYLGGMTPEQYDAAIDHAIMECKYEG